MPEIEPPDFSFDAANIPTLADAPPEVQARFGVEQPVVDPPVGVVEDASAADTTAPAKEQNAEAVPAAESDATAEAQPAAAEPAKVEEPVAAAPDPALEAAKTVLLEAAKAMGITETDLTKIPALIQERNAQAAEAQKAAQAQALEDRFQQEAKAALEPQATELIATRLLAEGFENLPQTPEAWELPENAEIKARYFQLHAELEARPEWAQRVQEGVLARRYQHQEQVAKVSEITAKYTHAAVDLVNGLRDHGATPDFLETVARQTHLQVERALSTQNSEIAALKSEAEALRAQVSGHAEAIAKARAEGKAEGLKAALPVEAGRALPNTNGVGGTAEASRKSLDPGSFRWADIPTAAN